MSKREWIELITYELNQTVRYIAQVDAPFQESVLRKDKSEFIRLDDVRWFDEDKKKIIKYSDLSEGTEDIVYVRAGTILRVSPIRKDKYNFWEKG